MSDTYQVPIHNRFFRAVFRPGFRFLFHIIARVRIYGRENVPRQGAYLIAINHVSLYDPPFTMAFWPICPEAVGAVDIWSKPGQSTLARLFGGIPVHRGKYDRQVIETLVKVLASGRPLLIAPEGTRSHNPGLQRGLPGIAYLTDRTQVPIIPVGIVGTTDEFIHQATRGKRPLLEMRIGQPISFPPITVSGDMRRKKRQENVDQIMTHIAILLPPEYRGVYSQAAEQLEQGTETFTDNGNGKNYLS